MTPVIIQYRSPPLKLVATSIPNNQSLYLRDTAAGNQERLWLELRRENVISPGKRVDEVGQEKKKKTLGNIDHVSCGCVFWGSFALKYLYLKSFKYMCICCELS